MQIIAFVLVIYGGFFFRAPLGKDILPPLEAPEGSYSITELPENAIAWAPGDEPAFDFYPPGAACRFNPGGGLFKACIVHMLSENLTWQTPIRYLSIYILVFVVFAFLFGRAWCGWVCPLGTMGDVLNGLRRRLHVDRVSFSPAFRGGLRIGAYSILVPTLAISWLIGTPRYAEFQCYWFLPYCQICPARILCPFFGLRSSTLADFTNGVTSFFTVTSWIVLGLFAAAFLLGRRIWCHLCPIGLVNSWFNRGSVTELRKDTLKCNQCGACADSCPMGLDNVAREKENVVLNQPGCVMCMRCVESCPRDDCLRLTFFGKTILRSKYRETR